MTLGRSDTDRRKYEAKQAGANRMQKLQETNGYDRVRVRRAYQCPCTPRSMCCHQLATKVDMYLRPTLRKTISTNFAKDYLRKRLGVEAGQLTLSISIDRSTLVYIYIYIYLYNESCFSEKKTAGLHQTEDRAGDAPKPPFQSDPLKNQKYQ